MSLHDTGLSEYPYPGLRPFRRDEADIFFGREEQVDQLLGKLERTRFLAVIGASGCGKSSLVRAGLLAALEGGFMASAGPRWQVAETRPGGHPLANLAQALLDSGLLGQPWAARPDARAFLVAALRRGPLGLIELLRENPLPERTNLLVLVDQFEEIFRFHAVGDRNEATSFVDLLLASAAHELPIYVVITMRSDFLGDCSLFAGLPEAVNDAQFLVPRLSREQCRAAIAGPAAAFGARAEAELVNRVLNDLGTDPDQLPLMQHALMRVWNRTLGPDASAATLAPAADPILLTLETYEAVGGLKEALSRHADEAFGELNDAEQQVAETLFRSLSERGTDQRDTRRPVSLATLAEVAEVPPGEVAPVAEVFRRADRSFLTPPPPAPLEPDTVLDISHESLIRQWKRMSRWVEEEAESAAIYRRLSETAGLWDQGRAAVWGTPDLENALTWRERERPSAAWARRYGGDLELSMRFLDASVAARDHQLREEEQRRQRELEMSQQIAQAQRRRADEAEQRRQEQVAANRRLRARALLATAAGILALVLASVAWFQKDRAELARRDAEQARMTAEMERQRSLELALREREARQQAEESRALAEKSREQAEESLRRAEAAQQRAQENAQEAEQARAEEAAQRQRARDSLRQSLLAQAQALRQSVQPERSQRALAALREAAEIRPGLDLRSELLRVFDLPELRAHKPSAADGRFRAVFLGFYQHQERLLGQTEDAYVEIDARSGELLRTFPGTPLRASSKATALSDDGRRLVAVNRERSDTLIWDLEAGAPTTSLKDQNGDPIVAHCLSIDDTSTRLAVAESPVVAERYMISIYDLESLELLNRWEVEARYLDHLCLDPGGRHLAVSNLGFPEQRVQIYEVPTGEMVANLTVQTLHTIMLSPTLARLDFSADGSLLAAGGAQGTVKVWDFNKVLQSQQPASDVPADAELLSMSVNVDLSTSVQISPDRRWLATYGSRGVSTEEFRSIDIWDLRSGELVATTAGVSSEDLEWSSSGALLRSGSNLWTFQPPLSRTATLLDERSPRQTRLEVKQLQFSADERWLACGRESLSLLPVIDLSGPELQVAHLQSGDVNALAFSATGDRLWHARPGNERLWEFPFPAPAGESAVPATRLYHSLAFDAQGRRLAAGAENRVELTVFDLQTGAELWKHSVTGDIYSGNTLLFDPAAERLATILQTEQGRRWQAWNIATGELILDSPGSARHAFYRDGRLLSVGIEARKINLTDVASAQTVWTLPSPTVSSYFSSNTFQFSSNGTRCAELGAGGEINIWDLQQGTRLATIQRAGRPDRRASSGEKIAFSGDAGLIAAMDGPHLKVWDVLSGRELGSLRLRPEFFDFDDPAADGQPQMLLLENDGNILSWKVGQPDPTVAGQIEDVRSFSGRGTFLVAGARRLVSVPSSQTASVWELPSGKLLKRFRLKLTSYARAITASRDGSKLAVADTYQVPHVWDAGTQETLIAFDRVVSYRGPNLVLAPDGSHVAALRTNPNRLQVYDPNTQSETFSIELGGTTATLSRAQLALSQGARRAAVAHDSSLRVYDPISQRKVASCDGHTGRVTDLALDGAVNVLASISQEDGTARLWSAETGEPLAVFDTGQRKLTRVAISRNGRWLATGDGEGKVKIWDLAECRRRLADSGLDWAAPPIAAPQLPAADSFAERLQQARQHRLFERFDEAVQDYSEALELQPQQASLYWERGESYSQLGNQEAALDDFDHAVRLDADAKAYANLHAGALRSLALKLAEQRRWQEAEPLLTRLLELYPDSVSNDVSRAALRLASGDVEGYRRLCRELLAEQDGQLQPSLLQVAFAALLAPDALADFGPLLELGELVEQHRSGAPMEVPNLLGAALYRAGRIDEAIPQLEEPAEGQDPQTAVWNGMFLAMAYQQRGDHQRARQALAAAEEKLSEAGRQAESALDRSDPITERQFVLHLLRREAQAVVAAPETAP